MSFLLGGCWIGYTYAIDFVSLEIHIQTKSKGVFDILQQKKNN